MIAKRFQGRWTALVFIIATCGCAVGPEFAPPTPTLPERWEGAGASQDDLEDAWWRAFEDPLLSQLIERARESNLDVRMAALRVAQSRAQRAVAASQRTPTLTASAAQQRERQSEYGVGTRIVDSIGGPIDRDRVIEVLSEPYEVHQAGFDAGWELDLWGRVRRSTEAADARAEATLEDARAAQTSVIAEIARTYFELRGAQDQLRIAQADVVASEEALRLAEARAAGGLVPQLDVVSRRARLAEARSRTPHFEQRIEQLINALALLAGESPGAMHEQLARVQHAPHPPQQIAMGVPAELARRRPDIRAAEARLHAATAEIGVAVADLYPRVTLRAGFSFQALQAENLAEWGARQWSIGPSLQLPIFEGGRRRAIVELRELQQQEAAVNYQRTVLRAWHEIENALTAYAAQQRRLEDFEAAVSASREAHELAQLRYEHGLTNFLTPLDAQRTLLQAEQARSETTVTAAAQLIAVYKALGGGWRPNP